jgi:hypothetical protein
MEFFRPRSPGVLRVDVIEHHIGVTYQPLHDLLAGG